MARPRKDWDKIVADFEKEEQEEKEKNKTYDERDFFRQLHEHSDDDARRAMEKSLYESHGTKLIMNWDEVKNGKVNPYDSDEESKKYDREAKSKSKQTKGGITYTKEDLDQLRGKVKEVDSDDDE